MECSYIALLYCSDHSKGFTFTHSHTQHSCTDGRGCLSRHQPAHQEQLGVKYLALAHINMWTEGAMNRTSDLLISG